MLQEMFCNILWTKQGRQRDGGASHGVSVAPAPSASSVAPDILSPDRTLSCAFLLQDHAATGQEELCEVAGYLGRADPWYESNINTLCHVIPKLATMVRGEPSLFPSLAPSPNTSAVPEDAPLPCRAPRSPRRRLSPCKPLPGPSSWESACG